MSAERAASTTTDADLPSAGVLLTDLYQLTMLQGYHRRGMAETAVFEFFVRRLPENRRFLLAAGLEQALDYLEGLRFDADDLDWLRASGRFDDGFLETLLDSDMPLDDQRRRHLQLMHEQAGRMNRLIEDLLMLSRLESQESALLEEEVDMPRLLREVVDEARALSNGRHAIELECAAANVRGSRDNASSMRSGRSV